MRRLLTAVITLVLIAAMKVPSYAVTIVSSGTYTASSSFTGSGTVNMSVSFSSGYALQWSGIVVGSTQWKAADNYLILSATMTDATAGIQICTNNRNGVSPYQYLGSTTTNPAGLILATTSTSTVQALPMCWRVVTVSTSCSIVQGTDNKLYDTQFGGQAGKFPCYLWMMDESTPQIGASLGFSNGMSYAEIWSALFGIQIAESTWGAAVDANTALIYIGADFANAKVAGYGSGQTANYSTTTLTVEAYHM